MSSIISDDEHFGHEEGDRCLGCRADHIEYRLVRGTSYEGLSIRGVYFDDQNKIIGWDRMPLSPLAGSRKETVGYLVDIVRSVDDMLEGTNRPILDEAKLEAEFNK